MVLDPRAEYNVGDRKVQFNLALKLRQTLNHMSFAVANIESVRDAATSSIAKLPQDSPLRAQLQTLAQKSDDLRSKIVATKEGGMITGEERIREHVGELYGYVNQYEGRPTDYQVARADSLNHELEDVISDFKKLTTEQLPAINTGLQQQHMAPITQLDEGDWLKAHEATGTTGSKPALSRVGDVD